MMAARAFAGTRADAGAEVAILLGTHNGARFVSEQLASFRQQSHRRWSLIVRDDGSSDTTLAHVAAFAVTAGSYAVRVEAGPRLGFAGNFLTLLAMEGGAAPYVAFSDQDDYWLPDKLSRAVAQLSQVPEAVPAMVCGPTVLTDEKLRRIGISPRFRRPPSFQNALVQTIAGGNTMVLNRAARMLLHAAGAEADVVSHDWWIYQLITGAGGHVIYDAEPTLLYRQHGANLSGSNRGLRAKFTRGCGLMRGDYRRWNERNVRALSAVRPLLTAEARATLAAFEAARTAPLGERLGRLVRSGIHRQTGPGQASLLAAAALGKI